MPPDTQYGSVLLAPPVVPAHAPDDRRRQITQFRHRDSGRLAPNFSLPPLHSSPIHAQSPASPSADVVTRALEEQPLPSLLFSGLLLAAVGYFLVRTVLRSVRPRMPELAGTLSVPATFLTTMLAVETFLLLILGQLATLGILRMSCGAEHPLRAQPIYEGLVARMGGNVLATLHLWVHLSVRRRSFLEELGLRPPDAARSVCMGCASYLAVVPLVIGAMALEVAGYRFLGKSLPTQEAVSSLAGDPELRVNVPLLATLALVVPWFEEILFRGLLFAVLLKHLAPRHAILVSAALFALMHDAGHLPVFVLGATMAALYHRSGRLLVPYALHVLHNSLVLTVLVSGG